MPAGLLASREAQDTGGVIFAANCAICHGANGDGRGQRISVRFRNAGQQDLGERFHRLEQGRIGHAVDSPVERALELQFPRRVESGEHEKGRR